MSNGMNIVAHNLQAMFSNRQLGIVTDRKGKSTEKLSSGYRINRAADDAAGLAISEKMRRQIKGLTQGTRNAQDGISMCQIADGALNEVNDMMHRITELSVQSANGTNDAQDRQAIQQEVNALLEEIDRVSDTTTFNELKIFNLAGNAAEIQFQSSLTDEEIKKRLFNNTFPKLESDIELPDVGGTISADAANEILSSLREYTIFDKMLVNGYTFPQDKDVIEPLFWKMRDYKYEDDKELYIKDRQENAPFLPEWEDSDRYSYWMREDMLAKEGFELGKTSNFYSSRSGSLYGSGSFCLGRFSAYLGTGDPGNLMMGANLCTTVPSLVAERQGGGEFYDLCQNLVIHGSASNYESKMDVACDVYRYIFDHAQISQDDKNDKIWIQSGAEAGDGIMLSFGSMNTGILGIRGLNVSTQFGAEDAISCVKSGLGILSGIRSDIGAQQNRLEHTIRHQENTIENTQQAESLIRDTDMANEMMNYSAANVIQEAGQAMLSQANHSNQGVLSLLQ